MEYDARLPSVHLGGEQIIHLEDLLLTESTAPDLEISLDHGSVTYRYGSADELLQDDILPAIIRSFEVVLTAKEGRIRLAADDRGRNLRLTVKGNREWAESRKREIESFFRKHGASLRTFLERYMAFILMGLAMSIALGAYYSGFGSAIGIRTPVDALLFGSIAAFVGGILHPTLNAFYPYVIVVRDARRTDSVLYFQR